MARLTAVLFLAAAAAASAGIFGRSKVASVWTDHAIAVDGDDSEWDPKTAFEQDGVSVQAKNDDKTLYLLITAHTREGRDQLSGASHQALSLWFLREDGKTRYWGALLPFNRRSPLTDALQDPSGVDPAPELGLWNGVASSTAAWPAEVSQRMGLSARRPVWELRIPLERLRVGKGGTVAADFTVGPAAASATAKSYGDVVDLDLAVRLASPPEPGR